MPTATNCQIIIEDNGIGIEDHHQDKIFEMFYRATDKSPGTGIGLYIVKDALDKVKGNISLSSEFGKRTKFLISIPNKK